jgi:hypothetical protein
MHVPGLQQGITRIRTAGFRLSDLIFLLWVILQFAAGAALEQKPQYQNYCREFDGKKFAVHFVPRFLSSSILFAAVNIFSV